MQSSGVYELQCNCGKNYIGQTGRSVATRIKEHISSAKHKREGLSSFADHLIQTGHDITQYSAKILKKCNKGKKLDVLEQWEIEKATSNNLLNTQLERQVAPLVLPTSL